MRSFARLGNRLAEEWHRALVASRRRREGAIVVFDRHFFADYYAYDVAAKTNRSASRRLHGFILSRLYPRPDLIIYLDAPAEILLERKGEGGRSTPSSAGALSTSSSVAFSPDSPSSTPASPSKRSPGRSPRRSRLSPASGALRSRRRSPRDAARARHRRLPERRDRDHPLARPSRASRDGRRLRRAEPRLLLSLCLRTRALPVAAHRPEGALQTLLGAARNMESSSWFRSVMSSHSPLGGARSFRRRLRTRSPVQGRICNDPGQGRDARACPCTRCARAANGARLDRRRGAPGSRRWAGRWS